MTKSVRSHLLMICAIRQQRQGGFSLLELLVAFSILALSLGALYGAMGNSARSVYKTETWQRASVLAQSLLDVRDSVDEQGWSETGEAAGFAWQIRSAPWDTDVDTDKAPQLHEVEIIVFWDEGDARQSLQLRTLRPQRKPWTEGEIEP